VFRKKHFPGLSLTDWNDWRWQLRNRIRDREGLERLFDLSEEEREALDALDGRMPVGLTPYYAALLDPRDPRQGLRRTKIPVSAELRAAPGESEDPLGEQAHMPVPGLVHTYPDKVLLLVTDFCATYCRYCMRGRLVGKGTFLPDRDLWEGAIEYVRGRPEIRDVLLSGGDPLILSDERLAWLLGRLRGIPHVEILRIGTKVPAVLPQRITPALCRMLRRHHPLFMSLHFVHPDELTPEAAAACGRLADAGIPLGGQSVLLRGVNDDPEVMKRLMQGLLRMRVRPYYLHQCDAIRGSAHFRTPVEKGREIIRSLHGHTSGYAVPMYMIDAPGGGGKVPAGPEYMAGREGDDLLLRSYAGRVHRYRDPL
jgi:lysine 2,3-aminomutase